MQILAQTILPATVKRLSVCLFASSLLIFSAEAQLNDPKEVTKSTGVNRGNNKMDQGINTGFDKVEQGIGGLFKKKKKAEKEEAASVETKSESSENLPSEKLTEPASASKPAPKPTLVSYGKFDFVPGEKIIFEDAVEGEAPGEFPSKWNLGSGKIEVAELNGQQVIALLEGNYATIFPLWKNKSDYLPEQFTVEFDFYPPTGSTTVVPVGFRNTAAGSEYLEGDDFGSWLTVGSQASVFQASGYAPDNESYTDRWHHISMSYNKGNIKVYSDHSRLANLPRANGNPHSLTLAGAVSETQPIYLKNIRIASGGGDLYKRVMSDGKFISRGILFDVDKATLKPQSMGPINEIAAMMKAHPELKFEIGGHTDGDGADARNLKLSQERANAVKNQLASMGIDGSRFTTKGYGKTKPTMPETSPEAKANNRRVEFVKL